MAKITYLLGYLNILLIIVGLGALSFLLPRLQIDLTKNQIHTLSQSSINFVSSLPDVVRIDIYESQSLPNELKAVTKNLKVILENFKNSSKGKVVINYFDPTRDAKAEEDARKLNIRAIQFSSVANDKIEVQVGYFGMVVSYGEKQEVLPVVGDIGNIEYYLISTVTKLTNNERKKILVASGLGEWGQDQVSFFQKFLSSEYITTPVDLSKADLLDTNADLLLINGPKGSYDQKAAKNLESWLDAKKPVVIFMDRFFVSEELEAKKINTNIDKILEKYGFAFEDGFVVDASSGVANFGTASGGSFFLQYPFWPKLDITGLNRELPALTGMSSLTFPWASHLKIDEAKVTKLASSSNLSFATPFASELNPLANKPPVAIEGTGQGSRIIAGINIASKVVLVADSDFIRDEFVKNNQQNLIFALNLIDYTLANENLILIRSKQIQTSPLATLNEKFKTAVKVAGVAGSMLIVIIIGGLSYFARSRNAKHMVKRFVNAKR